MTHRSPDREAIREMLEAQFPDAVFAVEDDVVWVSGMNQGCPTLAKRMARTLVGQDVPAGLVYDDGAARFGGVQFNYGDAA